MKYKIEKSITGYYRTLSLDNLIAKYDWKENLYTEYIFEKKNYFIKAEKWRDGYDIIDDEALTKICNIRHDNIVNYYDIVIIKNSKAPEQSILITICDYITDINFFEYVTYLHNNRKELQLFLKKIVTTFDFLHSMNILHKDINISNFGLKAIGTRLYPILLDFNLYKISESGLVGTPEFLDPTFDHSHDYLVKNERRGLGIFIYFLLTFDLPIYNRFTGLDLRGNKTENIVFKKHLIEDEEFNLINRLFDNDE